MKEKIIYSGFLNDNLHIDLVRVSGYNGYTCLYRIEAWNRQTLKTRFKEYINCNDAFSVVERLESKYGKVLKKVG